jgi:ATP phosphoribosyltransferase regulatory subunit
MNWLLPEHIADALPSEAARIEGLRRTLLDLFRVHGYELVMPPLLEHLDSLLTGSGQDLKLRTFKLVDQVSGRTLGVRADMTPQVARIDAHLLNRQGVTRLCYCGSVLHTLPASLAASREPMQIGAELYGHAGVAADREVIRLMAGACVQPALPAARIDVGHVGVFRALAAAAGLDAELEGALLLLLQGKDVPSLRECAPGWTSRCARRCWFARALWRRRDPRGGDQGFARLAANHAALETLRQLQASLPDLPLSFDLADLRGYHYHNGVVFAAYCPDFRVPLPVAGVMTALARPLAATVQRPVSRWICANWQAGGQLAGRRGRSWRPVRQTSAPLATRLRYCARGARSSSNSCRAKRSEGPRCDRQLLERDGQWLIEAINRNGSQEWLERRGRGHPMGRRGQGQDR